MQPPVPTWISSADAAEKTTESRLFYIRLAALYATPNGSLPALSKAIGRSENLLTGIYAHKRKLQVRDAIRIEALVGRNVVTREMLCPEVFDVEEPA